MTAQQMLHHAGGQSLIFRMAEVKDRLMAVMPRIDYLVALGNLSATWMHGAAHWNPPLGVYRKENFKL